MNINQNHSHSKATSCPSQPPHTHTPTSTAACLTPWAEGAERRISVVNSGATILSLDFGWTQIYISLSSLPTQEWFSPPLGGLAPSYRCVSVIRQTCYFLPKLWLVWLLWTWSKGLWEFLVSVFPSRPCNVKLSKNRVYTRPCLLTNPQPILHKGWKNYLFLPYLWSFIYLLIYFWSVPRNCISR